MYLTYNADDTVKSLLSSQYTVTSCKFDYNSSISNFLIIDKTRSSHLPLMKSTEFSRPYESLWLAF